MSVTTKTYYVLHEGPPPGIYRLYKDSWWFIGQNDGFAYLPDARRFDTADEARALAAKLYGPDPIYKVVKVTETMGATVREEVPLGTTGEDIRYALREALYPRRVLSADGKWFCDFDGTPNMHNKAVAATYATPSDALVALQENARANGYVVRDLTLVALRETTPTTVTVECAPEPPKYNFVTFNTPEFAAVKSIAYDATAKVAQVTLVGGTYEYTDVSPADVFAFLGAPSKGSHFNKVWKPKYGRPNTKV